MTKTKTSRGSKMQTETNGTTKNAAIAAAPTYIMPLSDIEVPTGWNVRSGNWEKASGGASADSSDFADLVQSIESRGQDEAAVVRPNPKKGGKPFSLVTGFRREKAMRTIAGKNSVVPGLAGFTAKAPVMRVEIRELSEAEARALNIRENTARESLSGPDLAWGVGQMYADGAGSGNVIAAMLGKNQNYIAQLLRIVTKGPKVAEKWRAAESKLSVKVMDKITSMPLGEQDAAYTAALTATTNAATNNAAPGLAWLKSAREKAAKLGTTLGTLYRLGHIDTEEIEFSEELVRSVVKFKTADKDGKNGPTEKQVDSVVDAALRAYNTALAEEEEKAEAAE